ncbi:unnamed protein product [Arctogadus glacialis]
MNEARSTSSTDVPEGKLVKKGSFKKKIDSFRRWSSVSLKRSPRAKAKTSSLSCDPEEPWLPDGHRKTLRPIVDSVFGQISEENKKLLGNNLHSERVIELLFRI